MPLEALRRAEVLLSFGISDDWTFERDVKRLNPDIRIRAFDHSVGRRRFRKTLVKSGFSALLSALVLNLRGARRSWRKVSRALDYFRFFRGDVRHFEQRVWYGSDRGSAAIEDIIEEAGVFAPCSLFAKIDIEGSEYRVLPAILARAERFAGLTVEFHDTDVCADLLNRQLRALREHFHLVHVHGNNYGDLSPGHEFPLAFEASFVNRALVLGEPGPYRGTLPRADLDRPNDPAREDYPLRFDAARPRAR